jgi:hypothetical protein
LGTQTRKNNSSNLSKESLEKKWVYKFLMPDWYKKAEVFGKHGSHQKNNVWIKKNDKHLIYVLFALRQRLLSVVHLLTGQDGVKKYKERLMEYYF